MNETQGRRDGRWWWWSSGALLLIAVGGFFVLQGCSRNGGGTDVVPPPVHPEATPHLAERIERFCSACHDNPAANTLPRSAWKDNIERMYELFNKSGRPLRPPPIEEVVHYFEEHAPAELPPADIRYADHPLPVRLSRTDIPDYEGT